MFSLAGLDAIREAAVRRERLLPTPALPCGSGRLSRMRRLFAADVTGPDGVSAAFACGSPKTVPAAGPRHVRHFVCRQRSDRFAEGVREFIRADGGHPLAMDAAGRRASYRRRSVRSRTVPLRRRSAGGLVSFFTRIGPRADPSGHVLLDSPEIAFALSAQGTRWLTPIDPDMHLFKLTPVAREQLAM